MSVDQEILIDGLKALRQFIVESRRSTVATSIAGMDKQVAIDHIIQCQKALKAIDAAIDEESNSSSPPPMNVSKSALEKARTMSSQKSRP